MVWSFVYVAFCRLVQLVVLLCRSERSKELEILVLRPEQARLQPPTGNRLTLVIDHPADGQKPRIVVSNEVEAAAPVQAAG